MECFKEKYNNTNEVIVIDDDDDDEKYDFIKEIKKPKTNKKGCSRKAKLYASKEKTEDIGNYDRKNCFKKTKQNFKCIINLTNIFEGRNYKLYKKSHIYLTERIVPQCLRAKCYKQTNSKCCNTRKPNMKKNQNVHKHSKVRVTKILSHRHCYLPLSSFETENLQSNMTYEDISSDDMSEYSENAAENLNVLIKRTKERESKISRSVSESEEILKPLCSSTPQLTEETENDISSENEKNTSLHSMATLLLEPLSDKAYSPANFTTTLYENESIPYSPEIVKSCSENENKNNIKGFHSNNLTSYPNLCSESSKADDKCSLNNLSIKKRFCKNTSGKITSNNISTNTIKNGIYLPTEKSLHNLHQDAQYDMQRYASFYIKEHAKNEESYRTAQLSKNNVYSATMNPENLQNITNSMPMRQHPIYTDRTVNTACPTYNLYSNSINNQTFNYNDYYNYYYSQYINQQWINSNVLGVPYCGYYAPKGQ